MLIQNEMSAKKISWFGSGGNIKTLITITNINELEDFIKQYGHKNYHILGSCSNSLIDDDGIELGVKIKLNQIEKRGNLVYAQAGLLTTQFVRYCIEHEMGGLEFMQTIPGTIGGLLKMNAGAYGFEMKDVVNTLEIINQAGKIENIPVSEMNYSYRHSSLPSSTIILGGTFIFKHQLKTEIEASLALMQNKRSASQPLNIKTLGSTFTNLINLTLSDKQLAALSADNITPTLSDTGYSLFAGQLIEKVGLKGFSIGGARFSEKHANFIENFNYAKSADFIALTQKATEIIKEKYNIDMKREIKIITDKTIA